MEININFEEVKNLIRQLDSSAEADEAKWKEALKNGFVATEYSDSGKLIGFGWIFPRQTLLRKQAVVEDMIVDNAYRGKGLGRKILKQCIEWARGQGVEVIELTTNPKRTAANELYKSEGFKLHETNHYLLNL